ncbi:MAG: DUF2634 domain-containing protein [Firmicutes bacterium]|nr:DUF2634 domain-containing protein [Bacillota bacterium]
MFPKVEENIIIEYGNNSERTSRSFLFDFSNGDFVVKDGKLVETDDITMWIEKILRTEKGRFKIYSDTDYGCHLEDLIIGSNYPISFVESELKREIEDALLQNPNIKAISNFALLRTKSGITVSLEVETNDTGRNTVTVTL